MQLCRTTGICQDIPPIPFKVMNPQYYTNWLPIDQINNCEAERMTEIQKSYIKKLGKIHRIKRENSPLRTQQQNRYLKKENGGREKYKYHSYSKKRYPKKEDNYEIKRQKRLEINNNSLFNSENKKYLSIRKQQNDKQKSRRQLKHFKKISPLVKNNNKKIQLKKSKSKQKKYDKQLFGPCYSNQIMIQRKKYKKSYQKNFTKSKSKLEYNNRDNERKYNKNKNERNQIIFDYYGISSTSASDNQERKKQILKTA